MAILDGTDDVIRRTEYDMKLKLERVRLSYPRLKEAEAYEGKGKPRFSASFHISKEDTKFMKLFEAAVLAAAKDAFQDKAPMRLKSFKGDPQKYPLKDGDETFTKEGDPIAEGKYVLTAHRNESDGRPILLDRVKDQATGKARRLSEDEIESMLKAGYYVNASVDIWAQDGSYPGIRATLLAVQFAEEADTFGGAATGSVDDFEAIEPDEIVDDEDLEDI